MSKIKILFVAAILMIPCIHYGQHTDQINSNRPGETMSAFAVGKSVIQVETGIYGIKEKHSLLNYDANGFGIDADLKMGIIYGKIRINCRLTIPKREIYNSIQQYQIKQL